jgi:hypothetical protein
LQRRRRWRLLLAALLLSLLLGLRASGNVQGAQNGEERCNSKQLKISRHLDVSLIAYGRRPPSFGFTCRTQFGPNIRRRVLCIVSV